MRRILFLTLVMVSCAASVVRAPGGIGDPCAAPRPASRGTCGAPFLCGPTPGGYCLGLADFGAACGAGSLRAESARIGEVCLKPCRTSADCRASEGYRCDTAWGVCSVPGLLSPVPPRCDAGLALAPRTFGAARVLSPRGNRASGRFSMEPSAALTADGTLVVAFLALNGRADANALGVTRVKADGAIDGPHSFTSTRARHYDGWLAGGAAGEVAMVWLGWDGVAAPELNMQIGFSVSGDGAKWSKPVGAHDAADCKGPGCFDKPMVVFGKAPGGGARERIHVFYWSSEHEALRATHSDNGGASFSRGVTVGRGAYGDVVAAPSGALHVVTASFVKGERPQSLLGDRAVRVEMVSSRDGGATWTAPRRVSADDEPVPFYFSNPQVEADEARGILYVAYPTGTSDGRWDIRLAASKDDGATWARRPVNDDPPCANHMTPTMALDAQDGALHIMWRENRGGVGRMVYAVCRDGGRRCSPNESLSETPFASYGFLRHSSRWIGEYDALILDAKRSMLHAVWTQTVDESGVSVARVFHAAKRVEQGRKPAAQRN